MGQFEGILGLSDSDLMLALCVRPENLRNPAEWCEEMRVLMRLKSKVKFTVEEAAQIIEISDRLSSEATGGFYQVELDGDTPPAHNSPEIAAFESYELAIKKLP